MNWHFLQFGDFVIMSVCLCSIMEGPHIAEGPQGGEPRCRISLAHRAGSRAGSEQCLSAPTVKWQLEPVQSLFTSPGDTWDRPLKMNSAWISIFLKKQSEGFQGECRMEKVWGGEKSSSNTLEQLLLSGGHVLVCSSGSLPLKCAGHWSGLIILWFYKCCWSFLTFEFYCIIQMTSQHL